MKINDDNDNDDNDDDDNNDDDDDDDENDDNDDDDDDDNDDNDDYGGENDDDCHVDTSNLMYSRSQDSSSSGSFTMESIFLSIQ